MVCFKSKHRMSDRRICRNRAFQYKGIAIHQSLGERKVLQRHNWRFFAFVCNGPTFIEAFLLRRNTVRAYYTQKNDKQQQYHDDRNRRDKNILLMDFSRIDQLSLPDFKCGRIIVLFVGFKAFFTDLIPTFAPFRKQHIAVDVGKDASHIQLLH